jgi:prepilin-type N-terminal cleavage/methylation domain-containing protein
MKILQEFPSRTEHGFSMVELVIALAIMLLLSAIAVPSIVRSIAIYRLNVAATSLQNIVEVARFNAIRRNTQVNLRRTTQAGLELFYVDLQGTSNYVVSDPSYILPADMQVAPAGAPASASTLLPNTQALGANGCIGFDSRGTINYATCGAGAPVVWFISISLTVPNSSFRAVTVTPMGQAKAWTASGGQTWDTM